MGKLPRVVTFGLGLLMCGAFAYAGPADVPVTFQITTNTSFGTSMFVLGSIPQLCNWNQINAIKMVPASCVGSACTWTATIGIVQGVSYQYKFVSRHDCATCYSDTNNVVYEPPANVNRSGSTSTGPTAPWNGKTIFYLSSWSSVSLLYSNTATAAFAVQSMVPAGPGRSGGEKLWRVDGINHAGETNLIFVFTDNLGHYDNPDGVGGRNYETPLDAAVVQDGQVYNYWPPAFVSTNRIETFTLNSTNLASRTIRVYLARGYNENAAKRYPVLYMHDGQNLFLNMGQFGSWHADTNVNNLIRFGKMRETIIVGVDNSSDRLCEYSPPQPTCTNACATPRGDKYAALLINELKPVVDASYRTLSDPDNTGILGSSMGGLISAWLGWAHAETYHKIGAMSSSFWDCFPISSPNSKRSIRIYIDSGDHDSQGTIGSSDSLLDTMGERDNLMQNGYVFNLDLDHTIGYGHWHSEQWWDVRSPRCFTFLFPASDEANTVLDTATPPRITKLQLAEPSNVVTWTSYRLRTYAVQGVANIQYASSMTWSDLFITTTPEPLLWNSPSVGVSNLFHFLRVRELSVPNWPN